MYDNWTESVYPPRRPLLSPLFPIICTSQGSPCWLRKIKPPHRFGLPTTPATTASPPYSWLVPSLGHQLPFLWLPWIWSRPGFRWSTCYPSQMGIFKSKLRYFWPGFTKARTKYIHRSVWCYTKNIQVLTWRVKSKEPWRNFHWRNMTIFIFQGRRMESVLEGWNSTEDAFVTSIRNHTRGLWACAKNAIHWLWRIKVDSRIYEESIKSKFSGHLDPRGRQRLVWLFQTTRIMLGAMPLQGDLSLLSLL